MKSSVFYFFKKSLKGVFIGCGGIFIPETATGVQLRAGTGIQLRQDGGFQLRAIGDTFSSFTSLDFKNNVNHPLLTQIGYP